jgi:large subunit ribosomal protein L6e
MASTEELTAASRLSFPLFTVKMTASDSGGKRANVELARGINAFSANSQSRRNGRFAYKRAEPAAAAVVSTASTAGDSKKPSFSTRRWYPADHIPKKLPSAKTARNSQKPAKLRKSITPGTVLILLSGRFRGKRVVFLKQLASGTLLITGPYKINGVPLRRVNQAFVIATSTKVDLDGVVLPEIDDAYFAKPPTHAKKPAEDQFFESANDSVR